MIDLRPGDNRASLRRMVANGEFVHSVVTDPPYGLTSVVKRFGGDKAAPAKFGTDGAFSRQSRGFMGKLWDGSGIERDPEFWRLVYDVMLPGAYIVAFSSSRTYGYMQVALEAAGFITHPMIGWVFNTGFPKGHDAGKAIDRTLGVAGAFEAKGETVKRMIPGADQNRDGSWIKDDGREYQPGEYTAGSDEAKAWDGYKHGTQALKPALEPIYIGQKPYSEKTGALNILKHGVGAINIDGCRVATDDDLNGGAYSGDRSNKRLDDATSYALGSSAGAFVQPTGRYPANLCHDGSPEVLALFPGEAARFFNSFPIISHPKANKTDRAGSAHATVKGVGLMEHLVRMHTPPGGTVLDPFAGSGTTGQACLNEGMRAVLMEAEHEYVRDIARRFDVDPGFTNRLWQIGQAL